MSSSVASLLEAVSRVFDDLGVRWYLFGAQAAILYGAARVTADVDLTVQIPAGRTTREIANYLHGHGFRLRIEDEKFIAQTRVIPVVHEASGMPVDVVLAGPGLEEEFLNRALFKDIEGVAIPVASPEDVIVMKVLAARPKDLEDIVAIIDAQGDALNLHLVRDVLARLEQALGQSDLVPVFDRSLRRAGRAG